MLQPKRLLKLVLSAFYVVALAVTALTIQKVQAAGVAVTLTPATATAASPTEVIVTYTSTGSSFASGEYIDLIFPSGITTLATCTTSPNSDVNGGAAGGTGTESFPIATTLRWTFGATSAVGGTITICAKVTAPAGNYGVSMLDNRAVADFGAALLYVGNANVVNVYAQVAPTLAFVIRNLADSADTNTCNIGILDTATTKACEYRLKITTNAGSGYAATIQAGTNGSGITKLVSGANDIDDVVAEGTAVSAGNERYGIALTPNTTSGSVALTAGTNFDGTTVGTTGTGASGLFAAVPLTAQSFVTSTAPNSPTTTSHSVVVQHAASISTTTATGSYTQAVTFIITANF